MSIDYMAAYKKREDFFQKVYITDTMRKIAEDFSNRIIAEKMKDAGNPLA